MLRPRRERDRGGPLLHQQPGGGREAVRPGGSGPLEYRERLSLGPGYDVPRGRIPAPRAAPARELRVAEPIRVVAAETASRPPEPGDETPQLRLERCLLDGSRYWINMLVCAGP